LKGIKPHIFSAIPLLYCLLLFLLTGTRYAVIITLLSAFLAAMVLVIVQQVNKLKKQQREINQKNVSLHRLAGEKEWLLKEVHHRVKNNLHTINSLLESQSAYLRGEALHAIKVSQQRVYAISLIHQKLYQPDIHVTAIDMVAYIHELVNYLQDSFETGGRIQFIMNLQPVQLDLSLAVSMGLILHEAITNSVKYAFPGEREGTITISITNTASGKWLFVVADNGTGLPAGLNTSNTHTLGMKLMKGLSEDIGAAYHIESGQGTQIRVAFTAPAVRGIRTNDGM
jgi:two-component sensor histidine kinase